MLTLTSTSFFCKQYGGPFVGFELTPRKREIQWQKVDIV